MSVLFSWIEAVEQFPNHGTIGIWDRIICQVDTHAVKTDIFFVIPFSIFSIPHESLNYSVIITLPQDRHVEVNRITVRLCGLVTDPVDSRNILWTPW